MNSDVDYATSAAPSVARDRLAPIRAAGRNTAPPKWNRAQRRAYLKRVPFEQREAVKAQLAR